jgi:hypothetical protein
VADRKRTKNLEVFPTETSAKNSKAYFKMSISQRKHTASPLPTSV